MLAAFTVTGTIMLGTATTALAISTAGIGLIVGAAVYLAVKGKWSYVEANNEAVEHLFEEI